MTRSGFDGRNQASYTFLCWAGLATSFAMTALALSDGRPDWMTSGFLPALAFGMSALVCVIGIRLMPHIGHLRTAVAGAVILSVGLAYLGSGGPQKLAWIMVAAGGAMIVLSLAMGKGGDRQTPDRVVHIRWPWR